jgi:hypothetical protein
MHLKRYALLLTLAAILGFSLTSCFKNPTAPTPFGDSTQRAPVFGQPTAVPTIPGLPIGTPTPGPVTGTGVITGSVSGTGGQGVTITAVGIGGILTSVHRVGDGPYTITGLAGGIYGVVADSDSGLLSGSFQGGVQLPSGGTVANVDITLQ